MRFQRLLGHVALTLASLFVATPTGAQTMTVFDVPGSTGTFPGAISPSGMVAGSYEDSTGAIHCFIRDEQGQFTTFDVPGAVTIDTSGFGHADSVIGAYMDANDVVHGYIRERDGAITTFDVPGAFRTLPSSSNAKGEIVGRYVDGQGNGGGFIRDPDGTFSWFLEPGGIASINNRGDVIGNIFDVATNRSRNFIRDHKGDITFIDVGALVDINSAGTIVGRYFARQGDLTVSLGLLLDKKGSVTTFRVAVTEVCDDGPCQRTALFTDPMKINAAGTVMGTFSLSSTGKFPFGFSRDAAGNVTIFRGPSSNVISPADMNARGEITGYYSFGPQSELRRGFIFNPRSDSAK